MLTQMAARCNHPSVAPVNIHMTQQTSNMSISIYHNIMWSKYKGGVFSAIHALSKDVQFTQIAETEGDRVALGSVDLNYHRYPYRLLFKGSYSATSTWQRTRKLMKCAWKDKADIIVLPGYERIEYWAMLGVLMLRGKPRAVFCDSTAHDRPRKAITSVAKKLFFSCCNGFFGYGMRSRDYLMSYGVPASKIYFRCQAAALPLDYSEQSAHQARLEASPDGFPHFVYVGRLSSEKGLDTLIQATAQIQKDHPDVRVDLIGAGPLKDELKSMIEAAGLTRHVRLLGSMDIRQLAVQYAKATAMILPSTSEPWGLVVNEAMSHGCPCIVSDICGCVPELVVAAKTGFSFRASDAQDLHHKMMAACIAFKNREETSMNCIEHMRRFSPQNAASQIIEGCKSILNSNRPTP